MMLSDSSIRALKAENGKPKRKADRDADDTSYDQIVNWTLDKKT
ncbi:MAG: hypothetical protein Q8R24_10765 [Legionellaceae bacterium]|nr:hypothetical protein [Legionellaceae bacterium]